MSRYDEWLFMQQQILAGEVVPGMHLSAPPSRRPTSDLQVAIAQSDTIVAHPGWQYFLNAIQARAEVSQRNLVVLQERLTTAEDPKIRRDIALCQGELTGLKFAATLVPQLVSMGEAMRAATADTLESTVPTAPHDAGVSGAEVTHNG